MNSPRAISLLDQTIAHVRPMLERPNPTEARIRLLWAAAKTSSDKKIATHDVLADELFRLAIDAGLITARGFWIADDVAERLRPHGAADIAHVIDWGLRGLNPFQEGPPQ